MRIFDNIKNNCLIDRLVLKKILSTIVFDTDNTSCSLYLFNLIKYFIKNIGINNLKLKKNPYNVQVVFNYFDVLQVI